MSIRQSTSHLRMGVARAFTLVEILVAVGVIIVGTAIIVPAFGRLIDSTNYSASVNAVTATLGQARALAIQNGLETGVAFLFDVETEQYTLLILEEGGNVAAAGGGGFLNCDQVSGRVRYAAQFFPARGTSPVILPPGTAVFGLPVSRQIESGVCPSKNHIDLATASWYSGFRMIDPDNPNIYITPWLFPRNDARLFMNVESGADVRGRDAVGEDPWEVLQNTRSDPVARRAVRHAQSFFIRFSKEGSVVPMGTGEPDDAWIEFADEPYDRDEVGANPYDEMDCFDPESVPSDVGEIRPNPEVWIRPVDQLAVVNLASLIKETGIQRPWLAVPEDAYAYLITGGFFPDYIDVDDGGVKRYVDDERIIRVSDWVDENAEIISFNRYTGSVLRRGGS